MMPRCGRSRRRVTASTARDLGLRGPRRRIRASAFWEPRGRGSNGTAAYADIESGLAIAVMRNHILGGFSTVSAIDDPVTDHYR
jgi:hypothetical protein